ncbi:DR2241 family protein [Halobacterium salinarum]|uniref:DR2241 family protein n=1 Tax=Halobacterium salinarum TaxID=2242 RepID=UPI002552EBFA|nr:DR2241 family protein [Halobacterium salinarum]MDL0128686.1 DR2241 family protein [Halobacterium salinarum]MDL0133628.1 DR2241 family protein [Halobacterium salinarum]
MSVADALVDAADADGIDFDGLTVAAGDDGYQFRTPDTDAVLTAADLREHADSPYVTNWYYWEHDIGGHETPRRAFLRWLEGGDDRPVPERYDALDSGHTRHWGELAVTVTHGDAAGSRRYDVRHADDVDADTDTLATYTDPRDARELVKHDDDDGYRPLSTAPSLPHGWAFTDLDGGALVDTIDYVYPATVANWHREREGSLDVDHWADVADRQTGIYGIVSDLDEDALEWAAEACCVDSQCLKRREWDRDEDDALDVPRGDGEFPCREPCSLFVAAARKFTTLEREDTREYTFELTPAEKEQIEDIIGAVADDRTDDIREADVYEGANRYRTRFLRAKRMDDHGLSGTPTYPEDHDDDDDDGDHH